MSYVCDSVILLFVQEAVVAAKEYMDVSVEDTQFEGKFVFEHCRHCRSKI